MEPSTFQPRSFVLAQLLLAPIYREDRDLWEVLQSERDQVAHYFRQIGQELVIDEAEGYAFLVELKYLFGRSGKRMAEHPIAFDERREGQSKMSAGKIWEAL